MQAMTERFEMRLDQETIERIDEWRGRQSDLPSKAEAFRRLAEIGLSISDGPDLRFSGGENLGTVYPALVAIADRARLDPELATEIVERGFEHCAAALKVNRDAGRNGLHREPPAEESHGHRPGNR